MAEKIVIAGSVAQKPGQGGHTWVFLQYLLGFKRLGWDVLFLDQLEPRMCLDSSGRPCAPDQSVGLSYLRGVMERFGLGDAYALLGDGGKHFSGLSRPQVLEHVKQSALLMNVMGFLADEEILGHAPRRVFLDIDPGFGQMWHDLKLHDSFRGHDDHVTIGENIGRANCSIPTCGLQWITTPQPVVLAYWPLAADAGGGAFTSIASWRGAYGPLEYQGKKYGLRVHEFRKFLPLPRQSGQPFQLALNIHASDGKDLALLHANAWSLVDPRTVAGDPWAYQAFIRGSKAEFLVAKNMYVETNSGWISDRSICYLASGRPVLAQDTGLDALYPTGAGLLTYRTLDEALEGAEELCRNYTRHARAARGLAEDYFDSDKVLSRLLNKLSVA